MSNPYRGRFAPSPTGPLHFGSLVAAVGSYCQAKSQNGEWLVRMEDIDPPREAVGAADNILRTLEACHLMWDGPIIYQSQRHDAYEAALSLLKNQELTFPCICTRKSIAKSVQKNNPAIYPGTCRGGIKSDHPQTAPRALRVRVNSKTVDFNDLLQGSHHIQLASEIGDFVIKRADGPFAYHLAVVVDDAFQGISEIVRGSDLLSSTPHHIYLQRLLGFQTPRYAHLPIAVHAGGEKLSKQTHAPAVDCRQPGPMLEKALTFLGHQPDPDVVHTGPETLLGWAVENWDLKKIPHRLAIVV